MHTSNKDSSTLGSNRQIKYPRYPQSRRNGNRQSTFALFWFNSVNRTINNSSLQRYMSQADSKYSLYMKWIFYWAASVWHTCIWLRKKAAATGKAVPSTQPPLVRGLSRLLPSVELCPWHWSYNYIYLQQLCVPMETVLGRPGLRCASTGCSHLPRLETMNRKEKLRVPRLPAWNSLLSAVRDNSDVCK